MTTSLVVGVAGGSASGKTSVVAEFVRQLGREGVAVLAHDRYYRDLRGLARHARSRHNFDHPTSLETDLLVAHVRDLRAGVAIDAPSYDFTQHLRTDDVDRIEPRPVVIVEGVLVLAEEALRNLMDLRVFVDTPDDVRFERRLRRDVAERGRSPESVHVQWAATVQPMHEEFVVPSRAHADLVIAEGGHNAAGLASVLAEIHKRLAVRQPNR
jgi:uridine kinase